jgi:hypothetical protein
MYVSIIILRSLAHFVLDATPFWFQLQEVVKRNSLALWRSPSYIFTRLFVVASISFFVALTFLQLGNSVRDLQYRVFAMQVYIIIR